MDIPDDVLALLRDASVCYVSTLMPDGSPQLTQTWVDTDGTHVLLNSVQTHQKVKNLLRDPRIAIAVFNPKQLFTYRELRGRVTNISTEGAVDHIERLSQRYLGKPYPWFGGRDQVRVILTMEVGKILVLDSEVNCAGPRSQTAGLNAGRGHPRSRRDVVIRFGLRRARRVIRSCVRRAAACQFALGKRGGHTRETRTRYTF